MCVLIVILPLTYVKHFGQETQYISLCRWTSRALWLKFRSNFSFCILPSSWRQNS